MCNDPKYAHVDTSKLSKDKSDNNHKLVFLDSKKYNESEGYNSHYVKIYRFFCEQCGEIITIKKEDWCRGEPDWY